jgi:hypothetical protein
MLILANDKKSVSETKKLLRGQRPRCGSPISYKTTNILGRCAAFVQDSSHATNGISSPEDVPGPRPRTDRAIAKATHRSRPSVGESNEIRGLIRRGSPMNSGSGQTRGVAVLSTCRKVVIDRVVACNRLPGVHG